MGKSAFISVALCLGKFIVTSFTAVTTTINNIGPGLELVGPTQNFSVFGPFSNFLNVYLSSTLI